MPSLRSRKTLEKALAARIAELKDAENSLENSDNPQILDMLKKWNAERDALENVLDFIRGGTLGRMYFRKSIQAEAAN